MISRRKLITGLAGLLAAPAIVRASSLDFIPRSHGWKVDAITAAQLKELGYYNVTEIGNWEWDERAQVYLRTTMVRRMNEHEDMRSYRVEARTRETMEMSRKDDCVT